MKTYITTTNNIYPNYRQNMTVNNKVQFCGENSSNGNCLPSLKTSNALKAAILLPLPIIITSCSKPNPNEEAMEYLNNQTLYSQEYIEKGLENYGDTIEFANAIKEFSKPTELGFELSELPEKVKEDISDIYLDYKKNNKSVATNFETKEDYSTITLIDCETNEQIYKKNLAKRIDLVDIKDTPSDEIADNDTEEVKIKDDSDDVESNKSSGGGLISWLIKSFFSHNPEDVAEEPITLDEIQQNGKVTDLGDYKHIDYTYTIVSGDNLYKISRKFHHIPVQTIKVKNNIKDKDADLIHTNDKLIIPLNIYSVKENDNINSIVEKFNVDINSFCLINNLEPNDKLHQDTDVIIPILEKQNTLCEDKRPFFGRRATMITSPYHEHRAKGLLHSGIDYRSAEGAPVRCEIEGVVTKNWSSKKEGNAIGIETSNGLAYVGYCHLKEVSKLKVGDTVHRGDVIGKAGHTGCKDTHVHMRTKMYDARDKKFHDVNPEYFIPAYLAKLYDDVPMSNWQKYDKLGKVDEFEHKKHLRQK